jgi:hypothetical protein
MRFEVLAAAKMSMLIFWIATSSGQGWRWRKYVSPEHNNLPTRPHGVTTHRPTPTGLSIIRWGPKKIIHFRSAPLLTLWISGSIRHNLHLAMPQVIVLVQSSTLEHPEAAVADLSWRGKVVEILLTHCTSCTWEEGMTVCSARSWTAPADNTSTT